MHDENAAATNLMSRDAQFRISTNTFERLSFLFYENQPTGVNEYQVFGLLKNKRVSRWIRSEYISGPESFFAYKVAHQAANGSGNLGEVLSSPLVLEPNMAVTQTFITIVCLKDLSEAGSCLKYLKSQFLRTLLGVLKITRYNPSKVWKYVPLQDFTSASDINRTTPIPDVDRQLYAKHRLDSSEVSFIETHVTPMG